MMQVEHPMARYQKGDHVKFEVTHEQSGNHEWIWLLVDDSDDEQQVVFGQLVSEPVVATDMKRGSLLRKVRWWPEPLATDEKIGTFRPAISPQR
jgi:hypothetical protein